MSYERGYPHGGGAPQPDADTSATELCIHVNDMAGDGYHIHVPNTMRGYQFIQFLQTRQAECEPGFRKPIFGSTIIDEDKTLAELGFTDGCEVTAVFQAASKKGVASVCNNYNKGVDMNL